MKIISIKILFILIIISFLSTNAFAETNVTEITIYTDSSWKVIDAKVDGWTSIDFDDSYWPNAKESCGLDASWEKAVCLEYPEKNPQDSYPLYFRKIFELSGTEIMSGKIYVYTRYTGGNIDGAANIYINDSIIGLTRLKRYFQYR